MILLEFPEKYPGIAVIRPPSKILEDRKSGSTIADNIQWQKYEMSLNKADIIALDLKELNNPVSAVYAAIGLAYAVCNKAGYKLVCFNLHEKCQERYKQFNLHTIVPVYTSLEKIIEKEK